MITKKQAVEQLQHFYDAFNTKPYIWHAGDDHEFYQSEATLAGFGNNEQIEIKAHIFYKHDYPLVEVTVYDFNRTDGNMTLLRFAAELDDVINATKLVLGRYMEEVAA